VDGPYTLALRDGRDHDERVPPVVLVVERRRDGRCYPVGGVLAEDQRRAAIAAAHASRCRDGRSFRATQRALAEAGIRRSLGMIYRDVTTWGCRWCNPEAFEDAGPTG
jgi:hypothetical protein